MHKSVLLIFLGFALSCHGCSRDYTPEASDNGEAIYLAACSECHAAEDQNVPEIFFTLDSKNANITYVAHKVHSGSLIMPKFPNIKGRKMRALSQYVLDHSVRD